MRVTEERDCREQTIGQKPGETRGGSLSDRQIVENFTQLYWRDRPPRWSPGQGQGQGRKGGQTSTRMKGQTDRTHERDRRLGDKRGTVGKGMIDRDKRRTGMTRVGGELGLGPRVSLMDILKGRKRDSTPVRTAVKRLGASATKGRVQRDKDRRGGTGRGRVGPSMDRTGDRAGTQDAQPAQPTQGAQPEVEGLRRSLRIQAGQGGRKAWCVWCGVKGKGGGE